MSDPRREKVRIRRAVAEDQDEWRRLRAALWPEDSAEVHGAEMQGYLRDESAVAYVVARAAGGLAGFVEVTIRQYADGCDTSPVGYVEGWYVDADVRRQGLGRRLVRAAERWARDRGCREMGSDCLLDNEVSRKAHIALGYEERERLIHFRRWLVPARIQPRG